jgi:hypothetical protein
MISEGLQPDEKSLAITSSSDALWDFFINSQFRRLDTKVQYFIVLVLFRDAFRIYLEGLSNMAKENPDVLNQIRICKDSFDNLQKQMPFKN